MKQPRAQFTKVVDHETEKFFQTKNEVMHEYAPIIGATGFMLYSFYKSMANRATGNTAWPGYKLIKAHLGFDDSTISCYNWLLEHCEILKIEQFEQGNNDHNIYHLVTVNPVSPELLARLTKALQPNPTDGQRWAKFKAARLELVKSWQPLHAHFKAKPAAPAESTPAPIANNIQPMINTSPQNSELVARLVAEFKENKLSEAAATKIITDYGVEAVTQQLAWLPGRESDTPLRTLRAALKGNWLEPKPVGKPTIGAEIMTAPPVETGHALSLPHAPSLPPDPLWQEVKARLQMQMTQAAYDNWVKQTELVSMEGNNWLIQCESTFAQDWLENRLNGTLTRTVNGVVGHEVALKFVVHGSG